LPPFVWSAGQALANPATIRDASAIALLERGSSMRIWAIAVAALGAIPVLAAPQAQTHKAPRTVRGELLLFQDLNYHGVQWKVENPGTTVRPGWNIRSLAMHPGDRWQICARPRFREPCIILDRSVHDASLIGVEGQIGSARLARTERNPRAATPDMAPVQPQRQPGT
jgi:hypothetical protein